MVRLRASTRSRSTSRPSSRRGALAVAAALLALTLVACDEPASTPVPGATQVACVPVELLGPDSRQIDLSGTWSGNDGGRYFIKQIDNCIWWSGLSAFPGQALGDEWIMAFRGTLDSSGLIQGDFVDVKGTNPGAGTMSIRVRAEMREGHVVVELHREAAAGHQIGVTFWQRFSGPLATPSGPVPTDSAAPSPSSGSPALSLPPG